MEDDRSFIDALKGMRIGGRYVVDRVLGAGGMGIVATARYPELQQKVAIKFLRPEYATNGILNARFVREARLAAKVKSEHFVRVFDIGKLPTGVPYLVMELLSGRDLGDELAVNGRMTVQDAVEWLLQSIVGIAEIHALGIVHRDLKPSNLFIAEAAGKRMIKVLDFGISKENAKASDVPLTSTDNLLGTPQYMSPEQVRASKDVDARSDIWALGVILYELLTGKRPFVSDENATGELFAKVLYIDPLPPREHRPDLPPELEAVILKCLARERGARYGDVVELAEALRPFASSSSIYRIDAARQALRERHSIVPPENEDGEEEVARISELPTAASTPHARRDLADPGTPSAPVTAMTSSRGSTIREPKARGIMLAIGLVAVAVIVGGGAFLASRNTPPSVAAPAVSSGPALTTATPSEVPSSSMGAAVSPPPTGLTTREPATVATPTTPTTAARPVTRPAVIDAGAIAPPPSAKPAGGTNDLILDRK